MGQLQKGASGPILPVLSSQTNLKPLMRLPWYAVGSRTPIRKAHKHKEAKSVCQAEVLTPAPSAQDLRVRFVYTPAGWRYVPPEAAPPA